METILIKAFQIFAGLLGLSVLVFVHELGHFLLAKWNNVGVLEFSIGFGKTIWQKKINGTRYALRLIPLGGFVRMVGDDPRMLDPETKEDSERNLLEPVYEPEDKDEEALLNDESKWFLKKGYFAKASIVIAGPLFNVIFAWLLAFSMFFISGAHEPSDEPVVGKLIPGMPAEAAGLKAGDRILAIDGKAVSAFSEMSQIVKNSNEKELDIDLQRGEEKLNVILKPRLEDKEMALLEDRERRLLVGITVAPSEKVVKLSLSETFKTTNRLLYYVTSKTLKSLYLLVRGDISAKNISGPIEIIGQVGKSTSEGLGQTSFLLIFLSLTLAIMNLLPIPVLDGGHLLFFTIEAIKGSPMSLKTQSYANQVGLVLLLALMIFAVGNDIFKIFRVFS